MDGQVELEVCANCKKEISHSNYVMHTAHCARNFSLCPTCKEPITKSELEKHRQSCISKKPKNNPPPPQPKSKIEESEYYSHRKSIEENKLLARREKRLAKLDNFIDAGHKLGQSVDSTKITESRQQKITSTTTNGSNQNAYKPKSDLIPCKFCELELPKAALEEHENYCGARTEKCEQCGEHVLFKYRQLHMDSNHNFSKFDEESGSRASWKPARPESSYRPTARVSSFNSFDSNLIAQYGTYSSPSVATLNGNTANGEKLETSREISRRLDCKTEYIRNLLHDSASITAPLRTGAVPRHYSQTMGIVPQSPIRRPNPPTELVIPCEFCNIPVPHEDLIEHETGCRPDLARFNPRRRASSPDFFIAPQPTSPDVELPCEFCCDLIPASELLSHQLTCV